MAPREWEQTRERWGGGATLPRTCAWQAAGRRATRHGTNPDTGAMEEDIQISEESVPSTSARQPRKNTTRSTTDIKGAHSATITDDAMARR